MAKEKKYYESEEFQRLHSEWRQKLKDAGFEDIEIFDESQNDYGNLLKGFSIGSAVRDTGKLRMVAAPEYYSQCSTLLWEMREKGEDMEVLLFWMLHCEGLSIREIARKTRKSRKRIGEVVSRLDEEVKWRLKNKTS